MGLESDEETVDETYELAKQKIADWVSQDDPFLVLNLDNLRLIEIPPLPANLKRLNCCGSWFYSLPTLPKDLTYLDCSACFNITALPELPESLVYLDIEFCIVSVLPRLPSGLVYLNCGFNRLIGLPELPKSLRSLICRVNKLRSLPDLPLGLERLNCSKTLVTILPKLPAGLQKLDFSPGNLLCAPNIPLTLTTLEFDAFNNDNETFNRRQYLIGSVVKPAIKYICLTLKLWNVESQMRAIERKEAIFSELMSRTLCPARIEI